MVTAAANTNWRARFAASFAGLPGRTKIAGALAVVFFVITTVLMMNRPSIQGPPGPQGPPGQAATMPGDMQQKLLELTTATRQALEIRRFQMLDVNSKQLSDMKQGFDAAIKPMLACMKGDNQCHGPSPYDRYVGNITTIIKRCYPDLTLTFTEQPSEVDVRTRAPVEGEESISSDAAKITYRRFYLRIISTQVGIEQVVDKIAKEKGELLNKITVEPIIGFPRQ